VTVVFGNRIGTPEINNTRNFSVFELMIRIPVYELFNFLYDPDFRSADEVKAPSRIQLRSYERDPG